MSQNLLDTLLYEMSRVRDELMPLYSAIPTGAFTVAMMRRALKIAARALAAGDVAAMIRCCRTLQDFKE